MRGTIQRIGDIAEAAGVSVDALRFYERRGLITPVRRRASGYREYSPDAVRVVRFIRRAQALGFTLAEVEELIHLRERTWAGDAPRQLRETAGAKVRDIDRRVRELLALRDALAQLIEACDDACPVLSNDAACAETRDKRDSELVPLECPLIEALEFEVVSKAVDTNGCTARVPSGGPGRRSAKPKRAPATGSSTLTRRK